jgi:hypothetical protein
MTLTTLPNAQQFSVAVSKRLGRSVTIEDVAIESTTSYLWHLNFTYNGKETGITFAHRHELLEMAIESTADLIEILDNDQEGMG